MITASDIDVEHRTIGGRKYLVHFAAHVEVGEAIWTQVAPDEYQLWHIQSRQDNTFPTQDDKLFPTGKEGFIGFVCKEGTIVHDANGGVYVDIKRGK